MNLLIDADFIVYKCCAACETEIDYGEDVIFVTSNYSEAYKAVKTEIEKIKSQFGGFSSPILSFRTPRILGKKFPQITKVIEIEKSPVVTNVSSVIYV